MVSFDTLKTAAAKFNFAHPVWHVLGSAEDNANDTVYLEKAATSAEWEKVALDSVAVLLSDCSDKKVLAWFTKKGFVW